MTNSNSHFICFLTVLMFKIVVIATGYTGSAFAGDGDVNYSAPYIIFDPETGKLVTVNPGPEMRMHDTVPDTSIAPAAVDSVAVNASVSTPVRPPGPGQIPEDTAVSTIALVTGSVIALLFLAGWYIRKRHSGRPTTKTDFVES